jgi:AraC-like DNA-binding protein
MNISDIQQSSRYAASLSNAKVLKLNGDVAIQSCASSGDMEDSFVARENMLLFVIDGVFQMRYGANEYRIEKNHMALFKKDIMVKYAASSYECRSDGARFVMIYLKHDLLKEFVKLAQLSVLPPLQSSAVTIDFVGLRLMKFIDSLESYFLEPESIDKYLIKIKLLELLFNLAHSGGNILPHLMELKPHFRGDIKATVEDNMMSSASLSQLAFLSGRSLSSFKRDFLAIYNMPPSTWLRLRKLEKARELLRNTTMTVTDVCYTLGFENLAHFSRLFKSHYGYSPSKSRASILRVA